MCHCINRGNVIGIQEKFHQLKKEGLKENQNPLNSDLI